MGRKLRYAALVLALAVLAVWILDGRNTGWTKTYVSHKEIEPVTEIEHEVQENKFVPGIDFLACGIVLCAALGSASLFFRPRQKPKN